MLNFLYIFPVFCVFPKILCTFASAMTLSETLLVVVGAFVVFTLGIIVGYALRSVLAYLRNEK